MTSSMDAPSPQDFGEMFKLINGYHISQAIFVVVELGIVDLLAAGPRRCDELARETNTHAPALFRILRFLAGAGLFNEIGPKEFELTRLGATLRADLPGSVAAPVRFLLSDFQWTPWGRLIHSVRTGETAFNHVHGMGPFDYFTKNPKASAIFNSAMTSLSARAGAGIVERYDFSGLRSVVDVGGGQGFLLATILRANPALRGVLFDLPHVVAAAGPILDDFSVRNRCETVGGSFFETLPKGGDAYIFRQIIHDWDDEHALAMLRNCRAAQTATGKVLLIERQIPPDNREAMRVFQVDMEMLVNVGGMERTDAEYRSLFEKAGFRLTNILPLMDAGGFSVFEGSCV